MEYLLERARLRHVTAPARYAAARQASASIAEESAEPAKAISGMSLDIESARDGRMVKLSANGFGVSKHAMDIPPEGCPHHGHHPHV
jgi:hypothetical protein